MFRIDGSEFLTGSFNTILDIERMPKEWRRSVLVLILKNEGKSCEN